MVGYDPGPHRLARPEGLPRHRGVTYPSFSVDGNAVYVQCRRLEYLAHWRAATTVTSRSGTTVIVTHAGVTSNWWRANASRHVDAVDVTDAINISVSPTSLT